MKKTAKIAPEVDTDAAGLPTRKLMRGMSTSAILRNLIKEKNSVKKDTPKSLLPDIAYQQGYIAGYQQRSGLLGFFRQFYEIIFRLDGSVLPRCVFEVTITTLISIVVLILSRDDLTWTPRTEEGTPLIEDSYSPLGHQLLGSLLAFLTVFRSQIAWSMYLSGYTAVIQLRSSSLNFARVAIGPMLAKCGHTGELLPSEATELCRLLKLFFFLVVEHLRSSEGSESWEWCQHIAYSFATADEIREFERECGPYQQNDERVMVRGHSVAHKETDGIGATGPPKRAQRATKGRMANVWASLQNLKRTGKLHVDAAVSQHTTSTRNLAATASTPVERMQRMCEAHEVTYTYHSGDMSGRDLTSALVGKNSYDLAFEADPTRGKVLKSLVWLSTLMQRIERRSALPAEPGGFMKMAVIAQLNALNSLFQDLHKVNTIVLPFPYNQLLKFFLLAWNFTLPFVMVDEVGWFLPLAMFLISAAFFGLDQVGVMLEQPFGSDPADISLLSIGYDLTEDLDVLLRSSANTAKGQKPHMKKVRRRLDRKLNIAAVHAWSVLEKKDSTLKEKDATLKKLEHALKMAKADGLHLHKCSTVEAATSAFNKLKDAAKEGAIAAMKAKLLAIGEDYYLNEKSDEEEEEEEDEDDEDEDAEAEEGGEGGEGGDAGDM